MQLLKYMQEKKEWMRNRRRTNGCDHGIESSDVD